MKRLYALLLVAAILAGLQSSTSTATTATIEPSVIFGGSSTSVTINHNPHVVIANGKAVVTGPWVSGVMTGCAGKTVHCIEIREFKQALEDLQKGN